MHEFLQMKSKKCCAAFMVYRGRSFLYLYTLYISHAKRTKNIVGAYGNGSILLAK